MPEIPASPSCHDNPFEEITSLRTTRLLLRQWVSEDRGAFAALNADAEVMRYMPRPLTRNESDQWADRIEHEFQRDGFGLWALEIPGEASFIGFTGLNRVPFAAHFTPAIEIGWRLARAYWGCGFATEAAHAALQAGFVEYGIVEIVAETAASNLPSRRVMSRLGMRQDTEDDFLNPAYAPASELAKHVLYRLRAPYN
jgi:ribosomal-protein-alanine N-acetyltransferase